MYLDYLLQLTNVDVYNENHHIEHNNHHKITSNATHNKDPIVKFATVIFPNDRQIASYHINFKIIKKKIKLIVNKSIIIIKTG